MKCTACKQKINLYEFDIFEAIEEVNPITFRKGIYHIECYKLLIENAKETLSNNHNYKNKFDEYFSKGLSKIIV